MMATPGLRGPGASGVLRSAVACIAIVLALPAGMRAAAAKAPAWVQAAVSAPVPEEFKKKSAVVLLDEATVEILPDGRRTERTRRVVRVLTRDGRDEATARISYTSSGAKVDAAAAWLIRPGGTVRAYGHREFYDVAAHDDELYTEVRALTLPAGAEAEPGSVFAWEFVTTERSIFPDGVWVFAGTSPCVLSRLTVRLPRGWQVLGRVFNHPGIEPRVSGADTTWELGLQPAFEVEPWGPPAASCLPALAYTFTPPSDGSVKVPMRSFKTWADVSDLVADLSDGAGAVDATVQAKAEELTRGLSTEVDRIAAIARFAQRVNYVSVGVRLSLGGGLTPHPASRVLACNYGDCKDKANLMRALLRAIGIESHYVAVASATQPVVWTEWPSPSQFNHAIVAVRVSPSTEGRTVVEDPALGRLLLFDPTSTYTTFGDLPSAYQGSPALVVARGRGRLMDIPIVPAEANAFVRTVKATLAVNGAIEAWVTEDSSGQPAAMERATFHQGTATEYARTIKDWVAGGVRGAQIDELEPKDDFVAGTFSLSFRLQAAGYAQTMRDGMLVFKPVMLSRRSFTPLTAATRATAVHILSRTMSEQAEITLPEGFYVSETGDSIELHEDFGDYTLKVEVVEGKVRMARSLVLRRTEVPASDYTRVRTFFARIIRSEQQPVVLERRGAAAN